jgi:hypothetical protein
MPVSRSTIASGCGHRMKPIKGKCVYCSYGSTPCPPCPERGRLLLDLGPDHRLDLAAQGLDDLGDPRLVTTSVLRCPSAVSFTRRFLTSPSAWRWVENEPKRASPMRTDPPSLVGSTTKIVVIACLATNERSTNGRTGTPFGASLG